MITLQNAMVLLAGAASRAPTGPRAWDPELQRMDGSERLYLQH